MVPEEWLRRYAKIAAFGEQREGHVRFRPAQTALLDALLGATIDSASTRCSRARGRSLRRSPASRRSTRRRGFHGRLREYQREALGWFDFLRRFGFGGCLCR